jgi:hypothetical protein
MECHKCEHRAAVAAGAFRDVPFEETPCSTCELKESSLYTIEFDEGRADRHGSVTEDVPFPDEVAAEADTPPAERPETARVAPTVVAPVVVPAPEVPDTEAPATEVAVAPVTVLADALAGLLVLPPQTLQLIQRRLRGMRYSQIAESEGVTTAAVEKRLARAMKAWPALEGLFCVKAAKYVRRKVQRREVAGVRGES